MQNKNNWREKKTSGKGMALLQPPAFHGALLVGLVHQGHAFPQRRNLRSSLQMNTWWVKSLMFLRTNCLATCSNASQRWHVSRLTENFSFPTALLLHLAATFPPRAQSSCWPQTYLAVSGWIRQDPGAESELMSCKYRVALVMPHSWWTQHITCTWQ